MSPKLRKTLYKRWTKLLGNKELDGMDFYFFSYMPEGKIYVGTSGWNYKHWRGAFYPAGVTIAGELAYYSGLFNASEINNSFYRQPRPSMVERWVGEVPGEFFFCPKMSRYITHAKKLNDPEQGLPRFFEVFDPFRRRLGPILIQLPSMLGFNKEKASLFFEALKMYKGYRFAYDTAYSGQKLAAMAKKCRAWQSEGHTIWVFFNNDGHAYAVKNAMTFKRLLARSPADADRWYG